MIYTSIPYDAGWMVKIDGAVVETEEIVGALMGFHTTPGEHKLEMEYRPSCVTYGTWISAGGLSVFLLISLGGWLNRKKKQKSIDVRSEI
jgi:LPXTG-motif cell wall-anchored protein